MFDGGFDVVIVVGVFVVFGIEMNVLCLFYLVMLW